MTADSIRVGVSYVDLEAVYDIVGLDHGDYQLSFQVVIDRINDQGGINGRRVEAVYESIDPIGTDPATEACIRLTEDEEVFAVMGQFLDETPLCYVETHDTALVGGDITSELFGRATAPWFTSNASPDRLNADILQAFIEAGELDGATVGVVANAIDEGLVESVVLPTLSAGGVEVVEVAYIEDTGGDESASDAQVAVITERFDSRGVDTAVVIDAASVAFLGGLEDLTYRPRIVATNLGNIRVYIRDDAGRDLSVLAGAVAGSQAEQLIWWDDPAIQDCIDLIEAADPELEILDPATRTDDQPENLVSIFTACHTVALFEAIATAAGPDLTNETFVAAGESLDTFDLPGIGEVRFGPDKHDGAESIYLYRWDDAAQDLISDGVPL
ncbi:MAG: ABC transporter substrate-binding protein [Acidimicrobiia bacterium]|nr:ABC transporter substrate-binding protein [Acidimicrobiia bacterium]